jgi:hypothetical protein
LIEAQRTPARGSSLSDVKLCGHIIWGKDYDPRPDGSEDENPNFPAMSASRRDLSVYLSAKLHDALRASYFAPYTMAPWNDQAAASRLH